ncbi:MAG: helix-turn-helix domain-containing protein [Parabacteroides gordonii]|nr:helix-turn-helix domain-containing protein [Parabacteroides gordonii]
MNLSFENSKIKGKVVLTDLLDANPALLKDKTLYKFIWVVSGQLELDVDHQAVVLNAGQLLTLSHLHHLEFVWVDGSYFALMFNSNFYCIYGNDHEVSCNGLLFHGSSHVVVFDLSDQERRKIETLTGIMREEFESRDHLQDEMLRVLLKRFIILCTRVAENRQGVRKENGMQFETIRKFYVLVDTHFKEKKQVQEYADMLNKSPKTLANLLSTYQQPSAIRVIHNRVQAEAERLLLYTSKSFKEIALLLGFEDQATFSRFFKNATGLSSTEYRKKNKNQGEEAQIDKLPTL